jgi:hypothetical protein
MWRQHLYSARVRDEAGHIDEFHVLTDQTPSDYQFTKRVLKRPDQVAQRNVAFIMDCGDNICIGVDGTVAEALPDEPQYAHEFPRAKDGTIKKGRPITFVHGYFAPKGTPIPDINELLRQQPQQLKEILRRANDCGEKAVRIEPVDFQASSSSVTDWDKMAREFERGKRPDDGATFTKDGKFFCALEKPLAPTPPGDTSVSGSRTPAQKKTLEPTKIARVGFLKIISVALVSVIAGIAAWKVIKHLKEKPRGKGESPSQNGR